MRSARISRQRQSPRPLQARTPFRTSRRGLQTAKRSSTARPESLEGRPSGGRPPPTPIYRPGRVHARDFPSVSTSRRDWSCSRTVTRMCGASIYRHWARRRPLHLFSPSRRRCSTQPAGLSGTANASPSISNWSGSYEIGSQTLVARTRCCLRRWGRLQSRHTPLVSPMDRRSRSIPASRGRSRSTSSRQRREAPTHDVRASRDTFQLLERRQVSLLRFEASGVVESEAAARRWGRHTGDSEWRLVAFESFDGRHLYTRRPPRDRAGCGGSLCR